MLATPNFYQNEPFIQVSSLPGNQQSAFKNWIGEDSFLRLSINDIEMNDCVHYQEYEFWFKFRFYGESQTLEHIF